MARFLAAQRPEYLRKAVLIAIAAICMVIALAAVAFSDDGGPFIFTKGVVKPDGSIGQGPPGGRIIYTHTTGRVTVSSGPRPTTFLRNGKTWLTMSAANDGTITISDPNGTGQAVIVIPPNQAALTTKPSTR